MGFKIEEATQLEIENVEAGKAGFSPSSMAGRMLTDLAELSSKHKGIKMLYDTLLMQAADPENYGSEEVDSETGKVKNFNSVGTNLRKVLFSLKDQGIVDLSTRKRGEKSVTILFVTFLGTGLPNEQNVENK